MIDSFRKRYAFGLDTWSNYSYLRECIRVFLEKYENYGIKKVFEVGIGSAISSEQILEKGYALTGIDVVENKNWQTLKEKWNGQFSASVGDIISYRSDEKYDLVIDNGCFHHLEPDLYEATLKNIAQLLTADGLFFLAVFKEANSEAAEGHVEMIDAGARRCKFFTEPEIEALLAANGFTQVDTLLVPRNFSNAEVLVCVAKKTMQEQLN